MNSKHHETTTVGNSRSTSPWLRGLGLALAGAALASLAFPWTDDPPEREGDTGTGNSDDGAADDETVGTLPSTSQGGWLHLYRNRRVTHPAVVLEGQILEITNAIAYLRGCPDVKLEILDPIAGTGRVYLLGTVQLAFDRLAAQAIGVQVGLYVPPTYAGIWADTFLGRRALNSDALTAGISWLPIPQLALTGALNAGLRLEIGEDRTGTLNFLARTTSDFLILTQAY